MPTLSPDMVIRRWFDELWNQGREQTIVDLLAADAKLYGLPTPDGQPIVGPAAFTMFFRRFRQAFPDIHVAVTRTVTEDDMVAAYCDVRGTHLGDALGTPATMKPVTFSGMCMGKVAGGQIVEGWNCFDFLTCYQQLGLLPKV